MKFKIILLLLSAVIVVYAKYSPLKTEYEWKYFDYLWKSTAHKKWYIDNGAYDPKAMTPIDVDRSLDGRTFVTVIRMKGVPATLHTISEIHTEHGPLLEPYPSWSWYESKDCTKTITNVYRVAIDRCNRIWVLDTGLSNRQRVCPAQLLAFDLSNNKLIFQKVIPDKIAQNSSGRGNLVTPIVETNGDKCQDTTVFMADVQGHALVVFDGTDFHRLESEAFNPEDKHVNLTIAGESFTLADGVLGMALSPPKYPYGGRSLYFRPLASLSIYSAETKSLKKSKSKAVSYFQTAANVLPSQASAMAFSKEGTLFFGMTKEIAIGCWNMQKPLNPWNIKIAVADQERLQFSSGVKVLARPFFFPEDEEQLLVMTNRMQKNFSRKRNFNEINFRILRASVRELIKNTTCDSPSKIL